MVTKKQKPTKKPAFPTLLNWPPSRGPMPKWMSAPPKYKFAEPTIERIEGTPKPIKVIPTKKVVAQPTAAEKKLEATLKKSGFKPRLIGGRAAQAKFLSTRLGV